MQNNMTSNELSGELRDNLIKFVEKCRRKSTQACDLGEAIQAAILDEVAREIERLLEISRGE